MIVYTLHIAEPDPPPIGYLLAHMFSEPTELIRLAQRLDAQVIDLRSVAWSASAAWTRRALKDGLGERWVNPSELGLVPGRRGKGLRIKSLDEGIEKLAALHASTGRHPLLFCVCPDPIACHRHEIARALIERGLADKIVDLDLRECPAKEEGLP